MRVSDPVVRPIQIVVTPGSGNGGALRMARRLERALRTHGYASEKLIFREFAKLAEWARTCEARFSHLICVGGDATLSAAALASVRLSVPFIPVPNGFGNIFAQVFGHRDSVSTVIELLRSGEVRNVDVGAVGEQEIFLSHRSYGFLERIQQTAERVERPRSRWRRHLVYYQMARRALLARRRPSITVDVDGVRVADGAVVVTVANVETYRGFLSLTPAASPIDGLFDVFVIPRMGRLRLAARLLKLLLRVPGRWKGVLLCRGQRVSVRVNGKRHEELRTLRHALPLLVPPGSVEALELRQIEADALLEAMAAQIAS
jgi:diacylglycerol kinase (ATP)